MYLFRSVETESKNITPNQKQDRLERDRKNAIEWMNVERAKKKEWDEEEASTRTRAHREIEK